MEARRMGGCEVKIKDLRSMDSPWLRLHTSAGREKLGAGAATGAAAVCAWGLWCWDRCILPLQCALGTRRKAPEPRRDFLEWAQEEWPTSAEQPRPSTKDVLPLFTLGRRNSGISLLVKCRHGQQTVMQWQKEGLIATRVALLVEGRLDDLLLRRLRERDGLEVSTLRRSEGLRHGCLSLLQVRVNSAPVEAVATLRRRFSEEGHPLRGPTGGKAWNSQVTVSGLWMPQLSAAVRWGLDRFMEMMDLDAERLQRFLYQAARSHVTFLE
ncbi:unnamed protein product [Durusdinium trenchii]|uniref:Uncharacterized protein n=1 Tax=Durusdinium trenchii TaxID=1381693 RepID=A0ABP0Q8J4_9DINO